jgi:hypothetical protein
MVIRHMRAQFKGWRIVPGNLVHRCLRSAVVTSATPIPDTLTSAFGSIKAPVFPMFRQSAPDSPLVISLLTITCGLV